MYSPSSFNSEFDLYMSPYNQSSPSSRLKSNNPFRTASITSTSSNGTGSPVVGVSRLSRGEAMQNPFLDMEYETEYFEDEEEYVFEPEAEYDSHLGSHHVHKTTPSAWELDHQQDEGLLILDGRSDFSYYARRQRTNGSTSSTPASVSSGSKFASLKSVPTFGTFVGKLKGMKMKKSFRKRKL